MPVGHYLYYIVDMERPVLVVGGTIPGQVTADGIQ